MRRFAAIVAAAAALLCGCGGTKEDFIGFRSRDACDQTWPVCDGVVGCILGGQTYMTGRFPARGQFMVRLSEPSRVTVGIFVEGIAGTGTQDAYVHWWENGCTKRIRDSESATAFVAEIDRDGFFSRSEDLVGVGDHLIEFSADAQATFSVKADVVALGGFASIGGSSLSSSASAFQPARGHCSTADSGGGTAPASPPSRWCPRCRGPARAPVR